MILVEKRVIVVGSMGGSREQEQEDYWCGTACSVSEDWLLQDCVLHRCINLKDERRM